MKITDVQVDELFDEMLAEPELSDWAAALSPDEYEDARRIFRIIIKKAIDIARYAN